MDWIQAKVSFVGIPNLIYLDPDHRLHFPHQSYSNDLLAAARINATFMPASSIGMCTQSGLYDGIIGTLGSNQSDFAIQFISYECLMDTACPTPAVKFDTIYEEENNHIFSSPDMNVTRTDISVHESLLVFDSSFATFMIVVYILSVHLLRKSAAINRSKIWIWTLNKIWLHQDADEDTTMAHSQRATLNASKLFLAHLFIVVGALINTDLVTYSRPTLIDSVSDAIASNIKIQIFEESQLWPVLIAAPESSDARRFAELARNQSAADGVPVLVTLDQKDDVIKKLHDRNRIMIQNELAFEISNRFECSEGNTDGGVESLYHKSKDIVVAQHYTILYSSACREELRRRVKRVHTLAMEAGIISRGDAAQNIFEALLGGPFSVSCLFKDKLVSGYHGHRIVQYPDIEPFLSLLLKCVGACAWILIGEIVFSKLNKIKQTQLRPRKVKATVAPTGHGHSTRRMEEINRLVSDIRRHQM